MKATFFFYAIIILLAAPTLDAMEESLAEQKLLIDAREKVREATARIFVINEKKAEAKDPYQIAFLYKLAQENEAELKASSREYIELNHLAQKYPASADEAVLRMQALIQKSTLEIGRALGELQKQRAATATP